MTTTQRARFVVEVDPRLSKTQTEERRDMTCSAGMKKALMVPGRILAMLYVTRFMLDHTNAKFDEERKTWSSYLVDFTAEANAFRRLLREASIVSIKISAYGLSLEYVAVRIALRRNRVELGYVEMLLCADGTIGGVTSNIA